MFTDPGSLPDILERRPKIRRRLKVVQLRFEWIHLVFNALDNHERLGWPEKMGLPEDSEVISIGYSMEQQTLLCCVYHPDFDDIPCGERLPSITDEGVLMHEWKRKKLSDTFERTDIPENEHPLRPLFDRLLKWRGCLEFSENRWFICEAPRVQMLYDPPETCLALFDWLRDNGMILDCQEHERMFRIRTQSTVLGHIVWVEPFSKFLEDLAGVIETLSKYKTAEITKVLKGQ